MKVYRIAKLYKQIKNLIGNPIVAIRNDHGSEFKGDLIGFCDQHGISHNFSTPKVLQQNRVVEGKKKHPRGNEQSHDL